jgi:uncharacterized RDD family membrane protein YckC
VLDILVLFFYIRILALIADSTGVDFSDEHYIFRSLIIFFAVVPILTYHLLSELIMNGQSIGKKITGIRVVNVNGGRPSISQFIIRWIIRTSDYMAIVIILYAGQAAREGNTEFLSHMSVAFCLLVTDVVLVNASKKRQRLGDMLAHTILIRTKQEADIEQTIFLEVAHDYVPSYPEVMHLSDRDINALKGILDTARKRNDYDMAEMASEKIKNHLKIESKRSPFEFLETLLKDYNYLSSN